MKRFEWKTYKDLDPLVRNYHFTFTEGFAVAYGKLNQGEVYFIQVNELYFSVLYRQGKLLNTLQFLSPVCGINDIDEEIILNEFVDELKKSKKVDRIVQQANWVIFNSKPSEAISAPFGTYEIDLTLDEEELFKNLHSKHRNVIRTAEKKGAKIKSGEDQIEQFYKLYAGTMARNNMHCEPKWYFSDLIESGTDVFCGVCYNDAEEAMGAVFVPFSRKGAYYVYGASAEKIKLTGAINYLHYAMMLELKILGVKKYDFVGARLSDVSGTRLEGIQKFKKRFGGELVKGILWKLDLNKSKCRIFDAALKAKMLMKGKKPGQDIIDQERKKFNEAT